MIIFEMLKQLKLKGSEVILADYIRNHPQELINQSVSDFADLTYVSKSSVVRFCQKLGFKGYADFKIQLATEMNSLVLEKGRIGVDIPFDQNSSNKQVASAFLNLHHQTLSDVHRALDLDQLQSVASLLEHASLITLWATGPSQLIALDFYYKMKRLGYNVRCEPIGGYHFVPVRARALNEVALVISSFAMSRTVRHWVNSHHRRGVPIVLITSNSKSPHLKRVHHAIVANVTEAQFSKMGPFASKTALGLILDCLFGFLFKMDYKRNMEVLKEEREHAKEDFNNQ